MLLHLQIRNLAVIEEALLDFSPGLNVISGETGAGKSMIIDALELVLGGRANCDLVRSGSDCCEVSALFDMSDRPALARKLDQQGMAATDERLLLRRLVGGGKNKVFINGRLSTLTILEEVARELVEISSQEERQSLLHPHDQLRFVDQFSRQEREVCNYRELYQRLRSLIAFRQQWIDGEEARRREREFLRFSLGEIEAAGLKEGEEEELRAQKKRLQNSGKVRELAHSIEAVLIGGECGEGGVSERLSRAQARAEELAKLSQEWETSANLLRELRAQIEELAFSYHRSQELPEEGELSLEKIEERLNALAKIGRKYGASLHDILLERDRIARQMEVLEEGERVFNDSEKEIASLLPQLAQLGKKISGARGRALLAISASAQSELAALGLPHAHLELRTSPLSKESGIGVGEGTCGPDGMERIDFYLSANPGEEPKLLSRVASGGERSRILLALKTIIGHEGDISVYIFDEVDVGIGGPIAEVVGRKLSELAKRNQVICITHWPQIASFADTHFRVTKESSQRKTVAKATLLNQAQRVEEIARMLGGVRMTASTRNVAREMIERVRERV